MYRHFLRRYASGEDMSRVKIGSSTRCAWLRGSIEPGSRLKVGQESSRFAAARRGPKSWTARARRRWDRARIDLRPSAHQVEPCGYPQQQKILKSKHFRLQEVHLKVGYFDVTSLISHGLHIDLMTTRHLKAASFDSMFVNKKID